MRLLADIDADSAARAAASFGFARSAGIETQVAFNDDLKTIEVHDFLARILGTTTPVADFEEALAILQTVEAIHEFAAARGAWVEVASE